MKGALDKHAPVKTKAVKITHWNHWFNDKIKEGIRLSRKKEKAWNNDLTFYNFQAFYYQRRYVANLTKATRSEYFKSQIVEHHGDYKAIYRVANKLLFRNKMSPLPKMDDQAQLAEDFNNFFSDKIANIMTVLNKSNPYPEYIESDYITTERFTCFTLTNQNDLMKMISKTVTKSCELDPINTNILKENVKVLAPALVDIVNTSLDDAIETENLKSAMVRQLLKKSSLPLIFKNFRPVSNLSYLSKLIEHVVCEQIMFFCRKFWQPG